MVSYSRNNWFSIFFYDGIPAEQKVKIAKAYKGEKKNT